MLRAVAVRTLKPGVNYAEFKDAWVPEGRKRFSAIVETTELEGRVRGRVRRHVALA